MKSKFKFFRGYIGTLDLMDGQTYATASIYNPNTLWTPEESEIERTRRMTLANEFGGRLEQMRNHGIISHEQYMRNRDMLIEQERIRRLRMINHSRETDEQIRLFQATTTITVSPTLWTKIKIFGTGVKLALKATWKSNPMGVIMMTLLSSVLIFIGIMKLFGA
jgi:hypothetical protein